MTEVSALHGTTTAPAPAGAAGMGGNKLDQETFLKLLVAQLKYQDPTNPADATKFLTETAQFTVVEKLGVLTDLNTQMLNATRSQSASSMIGYPVTYTDASGVSRTGTVTGSTLGSSPTLTVDGVPVGLDAVTAVGSTAQRPAP